MNERRVSEHAAVNDRIRRIVSMALLLAALGMFVAFHFLPIYNDPDVTAKGWEWWFAAYHLLKSRDDFGSLVGIGLSCFTMAALLIVAAPFLGPTWHHSRFAWCFASVFSGIGAVGITMWLVRGNILDILTLGGWLAPLAPYLNFLGLLLARRWRDEPRNPHPEIIPPRQSS